MNKVGFVLFLLLITGKVFSQQDQTFSSKEYIIALKKVTDVMVNDVTSPVAAGRYYSYVTLTSNEVSSLFDQNSHSLYPAIRSFKKITIPDTLVSKSSQSFATVSAVFKMAEKLLPSGYLLSDKIDSLRQVAIKKGIPKDQVQHSEELVNLVVKQMIEFVKTDGFSKLSSYKKYSPVVGEGHWEPTGPGYMQALEPNWNTIRPFLLESSSQFKPKEPAAFDLALTSSFYKQMMEVYTVVNSLTKKQRAIASFWDCNPFILNQIGHVEFGLKKISPGGHWMGITGIACLKKQISLSKTVFIHSVVAITLHDAFISCWDEKYRSNRIRPETAIKKYIDKKWKPLLQTPPFPEYTSGHSVISSAVAVVLTQFFGDNFSFEDTTEIEFGLPERKFKSFIQASQEAAVSRLYGGIHYRDAIDNGVLQGQEIGKYVGANLLRNYTIDR